MKKATLVILFFLLLHQTAFGKSYRKYNFGFFFGRQPSARSEAMGRTLTAANDGVFTAFYNPAGIVLNQGLNVAFSYASPYYLLTEANYNFIGLTYNARKLGTFGMHRFHFSSGQEQRIRSVNDPDKVLDSYIPSTTFYTISYAKEIMTDLTIGLNFNLYSDKMSDTKTIKSYPINIGLLKTLLIKNERENKKRLNFGASIKNVFGTNIDFSSPALIADSLYNLSYEESLPIILTTGLSYELLLSKHPTLSNLHLFGMTLQLEYEDVLNYKYQAGIKIGSELSFLDIFYFRTGYYSFKSDPDLLSGKKRLTDFTYGFGIHLPIDEFIKEKFPLTISFDLTSLKQPSYIKDFNDWDNFSTYSLNISWEL